MAVSNVQYISHKQAVKLIEDTNGKFFTAATRRRTTSVTGKAGQFMKLHIRTGVKKYLTGGESAYDFRKKGLLSVWKALPKNHDPKDTGYRSLNLKDLYALRIDGKRYRVKQEA